MAETALSQGDGKTQDRADQRKRDDQARLDELNNPAQVGLRSAGQSEDSQPLSGVEEAAHESVEELANTDQSFEAAKVEGVENAADHPERPTHTHNEYGRPDDLPCSGSR
jgi:hypothetical protein